MYKIRKANDNDVDTILEILQSFIGEHGCTWNQYYPSIKDIKGDLIADSLYVVCNETGKVIASASICKDKDIDEISIWNKNIKKPGCLHRLVVAKEYQRQGIAKDLIQYLEKILISQNYDGIHFLVGINNTSALSFYNQLNYQNVGEINLFENDWYCYEKYLGSDTYEI